jgi:hypothetical protein
MLRLIRGTWAKGHLTDLSISDRQVKYFKWIMDYIVCCWSVDLNIGMKLDVVVMFCRMFSSDDYDMSGTRVDFSGGFALFQTVHSLIDYTTRYKTVRLIVLGINVLIHAIRTEGLKSLASVTRVFIRTCNTIFKRLSQDTSEARMQNRH